MKVAAKKNRLKPPASSDGEVFRGLQAILKAHVPPLRVLVDKPGDFQVVSATRVWRGRPLWVAGVRAGKNYTSFYLMPVYSDPELSKLISPQLKRRMQGKSCFNFKAVDPALFAELQRLTDAGIPRFDSDRLLAYVEQETVKRRQRAGREKKKKSGKKVSGS